ncbi:MAG: flagellar hook-length control protein FliK [Pirellulaceae bacterium]|nr:flagellar hook-length control protein FliK [Pirellulaceae bacterium]
MVVDSEAVPAEGESAPPMSRGASSPGQVAALPTPANLRQVVGRLRAVREAAPTPPDTARFVTRVARAFQAAQARGGEVRLRLHPPELGALRLEVKMEGNSLTARIEAETSAARTALLDNLGALRERLAEQGVRIDQFDVDLLDRHSEESSHRSQDEEGSEPGERRYAEQETQQGEQESSSTEQRSTRDEPLDSGLDVVV